MCLILPPHMLDYRFAPPPYCPDMENPKGRYISPEGGRRILHAFLPLPQEQAAGKFRGKKTRHAELRLKTCQLVGSNSPAGVR